MAAYLRVYDSHHLQADCQEPGSAAEPYTLGNRVWATFTFTFFYLISQSPRTCCPGSGNEEALCALLTSQLAYPDR